MKEFLMNFGMTEEQAYHYMVMSIGLLAQILFSSRMIVQWITAEKKKKVTSDLLFWQVSLIASFIYFSYGLLRHDFALMLGQLITYYIYIRNIHFHNAWMKYNIVFRYFIYFFPVIGISWGLYTNAIDIHQIFNKENVATWLIVWGSVAQVLFTSRFIYQWLYSEKRKVSYLPLGFWILSATGSFMILIYAIIRFDIPTFLGQFVGFFVYLRNIILIKRNPSKN